MLTSDRIVAVIPARANSRGLPGKHLRLIRGTPLIAYTVRAACSSSRIGRVLCSTNDPAIARTASAAGAEVPFLRPSVLAADDVPTAPVIRHAVHWLEQQGAVVEIVVTLQPTSPLRTAAEIDAAIALLEDPSVDSAVSVIALGLPASVVGWVDSGRFQAALSPKPDVRRQTSVPAVRVTGGIYVSRRALLEQGRLLDDRPASLFVGAASAIDIDDLGDLRAARRALRRRFA